MVRVARKEVVADDLVFAACVRLDEPCRSAGTSPKELLTHWGFVEADPSHPECGDGRLFAGPWTVVQRRQSAAGCGPLDAALDGLMMHAKQTCHRKERRVRSIAAR